MNRFFSASSLSALLLSLFLGLSFSGSALARDRDHDREERHEGKSEKVYTIGTVESIDLEKKTFTVVNRDASKTIREVSPKTDFEMKRGKGKPGDFFMKFADLKVNDWIQAKGYPTQNGGLYIKDVDVFRD